MDNTNDGYEMPVHKSLSEPVLINGVPRQLAFLVGTLTAALGLGLHSWFSVPVCIVFWSAAARLTKYDAQFLDCFRRHLQHKSHYLA